MKQTFITKCPVIFCVMSTIHKKYLINFNLSTRRSNVGVKYFGAELMPATSRAVPQLFHGHPETDQTLRAHGLQEH